MLAKAYSRMRFPADDPGDEFAERGVGVGVGGAGDGNHAGELGVTEASEGADEADKHQRDGERGTCAGAAGDGAVVQDEVDDGRALPISELGGVASDGGADDGEDARADDDADAERSERDGAESFF